MKFGIFKFNFLFSSVRFLARRAMRAGGLPIESAMFGENVLWQARRTPAGSEGGCTAMRKSLQIWLPFVGVCLIPALASAQTPVYQGGGSFRVQCPTATIRHPGTTSTGVTPSLVVNPTPDYCRGSVYRPGGEDGDAKSATAKNGVRINLVDRRHERPELHHGRPRAPRSPPH